MVKAINLIDERFGLWLVIGKAPSQSRRLHWLCECQCEKKTRAIMSTDALRRGKTYSCGCIKQSVRPLRQKEESY